MRVLLHASFEMHTREDIFQLFFNSALKLLRFFGIFHVESSPLCYSCMKKQRERERERDKEKKGILLLFL